MTRAELKAERGAITRLQTVAVGLSTVQGDDPRHGLARDLLLVTRNLEAARKAERASRQAKKEEPR